MNLLATIAALDAGPVLAGPRSSHWHALEQAHLKQEWWCRGCGGVTHLQVHHEKPVHLFPKFELDPTNLITLCMDPARECHLRAGHLGNWSKYNPDIREQATAPPRNLLAASAVSPWAFSVAVHGQDLVMLDGRGTCFGGDSDPQDNGATASGFNTLAHLDSPLLALPMRGQSYPFLSPAEHAALDNAPWPRMPWMTVAEVALMPADLKGQPWEVVETAIVDWLPVALGDLGPGRRTGNAADVTPPAARHFNPKATAVNFAAQFVVRVRGGARFLQP